MSDAAANVDRLLELAGAACNKTASEADLVELNSILLADEAFRRHYVDYCRMHIALRLELRAHRAAQKARQQVNIESAASVQTESAAAKIETSSTMPLTFLSGTLHGTVGYFSSGWPVAYLVATVVLGVGLLIGAFVHVSDPTQVARQSPLLPSPPSTIHYPLSTIHSTVGRITGTVDCQWSVVSGQWSESTSHQPLATGHLIHLGDKFALAAGLMEITYDTGAKVILQGPVTYEVESPTGGFLSVGKLTAHVEKGETVRSTEYGVRSGGRADAAENQKSEIRNQKSSLSTTHYPLFTIKTPTALVTDLGTEFGVDVQREGTSYVETFVGAVVVTPAVGDKSSGAAQTVVAGKAVRVDAAGSVAGASATATPFVRGIRREDIDSYSKTVLADKPLTYWPLDEAPGARWIADLSRSRCSGRVVGAIGLAQGGPFPNERSRAIEFTGTGYIEINQSPNSDAANGFSIEVWAKCDGGEEPQCVITDRDKDGGYMLCARAELGAWEFSTRNGAATNMWDSVFRPGVQKQWTHVVGTFEPTGGKIGGVLVGVKRLYVNGELAATKEQRLVSSQLSRMRIGAGATELPEAKYFFIGRLAEMAVYDHPLSADRIKAHWEASGLSSITQQPSSPKEAMSQPIDR